MLDKKAMGWDNLFSKGTQQNGWYGVWLGTSDAANQGVCWGGDTGNWRIGYLSSKEVWHHVTVVSKGGVLYMFLDGEQVNSTSAKKYVSSGNLYIGGRNSTSNDTDSSAQFHGCIDDFKIYDYAIDIKITGIMGADADTFDYTAANGDKISLPYRVYYPSDYDAKGDKQYPILFFLHGHGETGTDNGKQLQVLNMPNKLLDDIVEMDNCIIVAPQTYCDRATNYSEWVASGTGRAYQHVWDGTNPVDKKPGMPICTEKLEDLTYTVGLQAASALLDKFLALDTVDKDRVYVSGISMGGCGTWELIARRPETFAAALPVCGSGILTSAESLKDIAIWAFHGDADPTVRPEGSIQMVDAIKAAGGNATITTFKGIGHSVWDYAYTAKNADGQTAAEWLLAQTKAE
jgi:poly(3-hydroxybutyrate) depolymerase